jgi:hypothetical protein
MPGQGRGREAVNGSLLLLWWKGKTKAKTKVIPQGILFPGNQNYLQSL